MKSHRARSLPSVPALAGVVSYRSETAMEDGGRSAPRLGIDVALRGNTKSQRQGAPQHLRRHYAVCLGDGRFV